MRYAIFSDIQGNRQAWEAILADMEELQVQAAVCLGDVVGSGPRPLDVLRGVRARTANLIMGDGDAAVAGLLDPAGLDPGRRPGIAWTRDCLGPEEVDLLSKMPLAIRTGELLFAHAETVEPGRFRCVDNVEEASRNFASPDHRVAFLGHGHHACVFEVQEDGTVGERAARDCRLADGRRYIVNVGSAGHPPGAGDVRARYVVYDSDTRELFFRCVPFDAAGCRADFVAAGLPLPSWLAQGADAQAAGDVATAAPSGATGPDHSSGAGKPAPRPGARSAPVVVEQPLPPPPATSPIGRRPVIAGVLALLSAMVLLVVAGVMVTRHLYVKWSDGETIAASPGKIPPESAAPGPPDPGREGPAGTGADGSGIAPVDGPPAKVPEQEPAPEAPPGPELPAVASEAEPEPGSQPAPEVPAVAAAPEPRPAPVPEPAPADPGPPPIPPEPENAGEATPQAQGILFYAPLDESQDELTARDLVGDRDLDVAGGLPGVVGQVGLACSLERQNGSSALLSEPRPLPELKALTISFWIRRPAPPAPDDPEAATKEKPAAKKAPDPPMTLVSLKDFCEVRLEDNHVVADMDRQGALARVAFPPDHRWHHVVVTNGDGKTAVWIDHRSQSEPVAESLAAPPAGGAAVQIGSTGAHFHVDEVAIWNRRLTPVDRQILYRNGRLETPVLTPPRVIAHWGFDDESTSRRFGDSTGRHVLGAYKAWRAVKGIAPNPVPLTSASNPQAAQVWQLAERQEDAGSFGMKRDVPFTYEGWFTLGRGSTVYLGGTIPPAGDGEAGGWSLEARPAKGATGSLAFTFINGSTRAQALAGGLSIYDGRPHHIAAVWNPFATPTHGTITIHLDGREAGTAPLAPADMGVARGGQFRIVATRNPVVLDELRVTSGALKPGEFLTAGVVPGDAAGGAAGDVAGNATEAPKGESVMQRLAREAAERRAKVKAEREARRKAAEARRNRE